MDALIRAVEKLAAQWADDLKHIRDCRRMYCERCAAIEVAVKDASEKAGR